MRMSSAALFLEPAPAFPFSAMMTTFADRPPLSDVTDEELMSRWVESRSRGRGDVAAYEALFHRWKGRVRGRIAAILGQVHRSRTDDVFQEVWIEVARAPVWNPTSFRSWILVVARNKALGVVEANPPGRNVSLTATAGEEDDGTLALDSHVGPIGSTPESTVGARRMLCALASALSTAPDPQREAWKLHYIEGLTLDAVADRMGSPRPTARTRVRLANERVAAYLEEHRIDPTLLEDTP